MKISKRYAIPAAIAVSALSLAGCGSLASSHDNANVDQEIRNGQVVLNSGNKVGTVTRIDTPGYFPAIVRVCTGTEGLYVSESSTGIVSVVPQDPECGAKLSSGSVSGAANTVAPNKDDSDGSDGK